VEHQRWNSIFPAAAAAAVYMVYCLILLVELAPKQHLALGIAVLSAGGGQ
jgi:hypothetical protein